ncbi:hypothetical protein FQZ97_1072620 [compost metagenome]
MGSKTSQVLIAAVIGSAKSEPARANMMANVRGGPLILSTNGPIRKLPSTPPMPHTHRKGVTERTPPTSWSASRGAMNVYMPRLAMAASRETRRMVAT